MSDGGDRADAPPPNLVPVPVDDLDHAEPPRTIYVIEDLIPLALVLLGGHGGAGKTILALILAAHVAAGVPFAGRAVRRGRVVFASLEDDGALVRFRLKKILAAYRLDPKAVARNLIVLDGSAGNATLAAEFGDHGQRMVLPTATLEELAEVTSGAVLVIVDNASDAFDGNENDRRQVRAFMRLLAQLGRDTGAAVLLLAHLDKVAARYGSQGNSYSGSTAWHNSSRARHALLRDGQSIELRMEKNNLGPLAEPVYFRWNDSGVLIPADPLEMLDADDPNIAADNAAVMECIRLAADAEVNIPTARLGAHNTFGALSTLPEMPGWAKRGKEGRERFWAALTRLSRIGWIEREPYRTAGRHNSERWSIATAAPERFRQPATWGRGASK
ncbi:MAG: AAA family ATPase [Lysobacter sp.]